MQLGRLNDADEMNLYPPNPLIDSPFGPGDLEWLYRQQDVDGATLSSRLSQLAPVSFTNGVDGARRRQAVRARFVGPEQLSRGRTTTRSGAFPHQQPTSAHASNCGRPSNAGSDRTQARRGMPTPGLAHRDKKINLNYPLPVSNDPNEPIRQKWINDTYQLLKSVLPPKAIDTAEELAQLSQYVINIVDFRDTDCTMTHWVNPDVQLAGIAERGHRGGPATAARYRFCRSRRC